MTKAVDLESLWARLALAPRAGKQFRSVRAADTGSLDVHVALRSTDEARCLLFDLAAPDDRASGFEAGGLRLTQVVAGQGYAMALILEDRSQSDLFTTICCDLIGYAGSARTVPPLALVMERLEAWQHFLRSLSGGMGREAVIGLTGELHVLDALLDRDAALFATWLSPADGLQDFEHGGHALEVKTTAGPGWQIGVSNADQLDTAGLRRLDLIHVRLAGDAAGETLENLIGRLSGKLVDDAAQRNFSNALVRRGLSPDDRAALSGLRLSLQAATAFHVDDSFPRLTKPELPSAIVDIRYTLDLAQLQHLAMPAAEIFDIYGGEQT